MKKTIAALGASVLGLGSAVVLGAAPATAEPLPACEDFAEQVGGNIATPDVMELWIENCVPQYGLGKAEFTIVPDEDNPTTEFPEGFVPLDEAGVEGSAVTGTTTLDQAALGAYFAPLSGGEAVDNLIPIIPGTLLDETATSQTYLALTLVPITEITDANPETVPAAVVEACEYEEAVYGGWIASYAPIDTTFSQTVNGTAWNYTIEAQSPDSYFLVTGGDDPWLCATDGETAISGPFESTGITVLASVLPFIPEFAPFGGPASLDQLIDSTGAASLEQLEISPAAIGESGLYTLGIFGPNAVAAPPALAATGSDGNSLVLPAIIVGGVVLLGGALVAVSVIRKRRKDEPATTLDTPDTTV